MHNKMKSAKIIISTLPQSTTLTKISKMILFSYILIIVSLILIVLIDDVESIDCQGHAEPKSFFYWHNWVDFNGRSHLSRCQVTHWTCVKLFKGAETWLDKYAGVAQNIAFTTIPPGSISKPHNNPVAQLILFMATSEIGEVISDWSFGGQQHNFTVGDILFGDDVHATDGGHISSNSFGMVDVNLLLVQYGFVL
jgi:hypothetical protein